MDIDGQRRRSPAIFWRIGPLVSWLSPDTQPPHDPNAQHRGANPRRGPNARYFYWNIAPVLSVRVLASAPLSPHSRLGDRTRRGLRRRPSALLRADGKPSWPLAPRRHPADRFPVGRTDSWSRGTWAVPSRSPESRSSAAFCLPDDLQARNGRNPGPGSRYLGAAIGERVMAAVTVVALPIASPPRVWNRRLSESFRFLPVRAHASLTCGGEGWNRWQSIYAIARVLGAGTDLAWFARP